MAEPRPKSIASTPSLSSTVKSICDILRRSNCASALQYVPELTWILFLRILDAQETRAREEAEAIGDDFTPALPAPFRWQDWAAPCNVEQEARTPEGQLVGWKRQALGSRIGTLIEFVNKELLPYLHGLDTLPDGRPNPSATPKQRVIGRIMTAVERVRVDTEADFIDILDRLHTIQIDHIDDTHVFTLSQVYEDLLLKMGEKNSDGGQFFTPREVVRAMVATLNPVFGETVYDPCCGTGGFLAQSYEWMSRRMGDQATGTDLERLKHDTFFGREKENLVFPIALANLVLHGIDQPNLWHGNTLADQPTYAGLFEQAPPTFDVILTNPPFGGKESSETQDRYSFHSSATQVLFLQHLLDELALPSDEQPGGRCGVVLDEGLLFRTNESAFVETKRRLLDECELWCIVSLPGGVFSTAGAGVKTNLLFFTKGRPTERTWYYDLSHVKMGKKSPMTLAHFGWNPDFTLITDDAALPASLVEDWHTREGNEGRLFPTFARLLAWRGTPQADSDVSWTIDVAARRAQARADMAPHEAEAVRCREEAVTLREQMAALKKAKASEAAWLAVQQQWQAMDKAARDAQARAAAIDAAAFDLKAVNPNARVTQDTRSPSEILAAITAHGRDMVAALDRLRRLVA
ncbi:type I restriction-modification system subunit M [Sphaerotilus sp.]|uniref:type I restriction-modification system subunit M n=1 Tax=Sphaerotilus sp. TaxID=2093942 RepID=UPI0025D461BF|nr:type I restriction-modification system subunit M [Sphaerotilus sp.]